MNARKAKELITEVMREYAYTADITYRINENDTNLVTFTVDYGFKKPYLFHAEFLFNKKKLIWVTTSDIGININIINDVKKAIKHMEE